MADNLILIAVKADDQASGPLNQIATGALRGLGDAAVRMAGDAVQALAGFTVSSITAAGNFEQSLNVLQAASGATSGQMDRMRALAVALGNDMALPGASAQDAATAMLELSKAGLTVDQAMAAATGTLQLAAAAETDASTAASIVAGALNAFHLEGTAAAQVADQLAAGANASAASITDLAAGFQQAGFAFDATGQHTDDLITSLSMLTNVGLTGTDAGTALKNAMMQLMAPTSAAASTMQQYGINVRDAQGTMLPFRDIIGVLQTQLGGLSAAQREAALKTILQGDGMKAMLPLISAGVAGFDAMQAKVNQSGAAQAMAAAQMTGFNGAMGGLSNAVETLQLVLGTALLPMLTTLVTIAAGAVNTITTFAQALMGSADAFTQLGPVAQFAVNALQSIVTGFGQGGILGALQGLVGGLSAAWPQIVGWFALAGTTIVAQLAAWGQAFLTWIVPIVVPMLAQLAATAVAIGGWIVAQAPAFVAQLAAWGTAFIGWIAPYIPPALAALGGFAASVWGWIAAQAPVLLGMIAGWGQSLVAWIGPAIPPALAALGGLASSVFAWVSAQAAPLLTQFGVWAQALVTWIVPATVQFLSAWPGMLSSFLDWIASAAGPILAQLGTWAIQFVSWIVPMIPSFLVGLGGVAVALATFIAETAVVIASRVVMWATSLLGWVATNVLPALPGILGDILSSILGWIGTAASAIGNVALDIGKSLVDGFIKGITGGAASVIDAAKNLARSAYDAAMGALQAHSPSRLFTKVGGTVPAGMSVGITAGMPAVESNLINGIAGLSEKAATALDAGAKAIAAAASYSGPGGSGLSGFLASFAELATQFNATAIALGGRILGTANRFADAIGKVAGAIGPAVEGLQALSGFVAPSQAAMQAFTDGFARVLTMLYAVAQQFADGSFKASTTFAESAGALIAVIEPAVTGFEALSTFVRPVPGLIQTFTDVLAWLVARFIAAGHWLQGPGLSAAVTFADAAGTITGILGTAVEGFGALAAFAKPAPGLIQAFTDVVAWLVARFALAGTWLQSQGMPAAVAFADAAAAIVGLVAPAITGFTQLATFVRPVPGLIQTFTDVVAWLVARFIAAGTWLQSQGLAAAVAFADAAGTIIGLIGGGVEAFAKLATFQAIPQSAILAFGQALQGTIALLMTVAHTWEQGAVEAVAVFSEAAATAIGVIGAGVDGFVKLADFEGVPEAAIAAFGDALDRALQALVVLAGQFAVEAVAAAAAFGEGVGRAIGFIGGAVDSFAKLADVGRLSQDAVNAFSFNIVLVVAQLQQLAQVFTADALTAVGVFAAAVTQAIAGLGGAGDSLMQLAESKRLDPDAVNAWSFNVVLVVAQLQQLAQVFSTDALTAAGQFAAGVVSVVASVKSALETIASLANAPQLQGEVLGAFLDAAQVLLTQMASYLPPNANSIGQNTIIGLITGILAQRANLITAMVSTVLAAVAAAQQTLGIASPSTVFDEMGMQSGQGYVQGLEGQQSPVVAASAGLAQAATTAALPTLRGTPTAAGPTSNARSVTIQVAPGAIVIHGAPGQRETAMADAALARLTQLTRMAATG